MLHGRSVERRTDALQHCFTLFALLAEHPDLDQFVGEQVDVDLVQHRRGQAVLADDDDWMQMVRFRAQLAPLGGSQWSHWTRP